MLVRDKQGDSCRENTSAPCVFGCNIQTVAEPQVHGKGPSGGERKVRFGRDELLVNCGGGDDCRTTLGELLHFAFSGKPKQKYGRDKLGSGRKEITFRIPSFV